MYICMSAYKLMNIVAIQQGLSSQYGAALSLSPPIELVFPPILFIFFHLPAHKLLIYFKFRGEFELAKEI